MTTIYLIRHAEAEGNLYRIAQGQNNSNLTDHGWRQVEALARRFSGIHIDAVYASDLYRTCATASAVYLPKNLPLHRMTSLREICIGAWETLTWGEIYRRWPEQMKYFSHQPHKWQIPDAEPPLQAQARIIHALHQIAAENEGQTVAVFSHGYVTRLALAYLQGYTLEEMGKTPTGDNTAVSCLTAEDGELRVVFRDDNSHLSALNVSSSKRANGLEPGLWFRPLSLPEDSGLLISLLSSDWSGSEPFDHARLLRDAQTRRTLIGYLREDPVGVLQLGPEPGWIATTWIHPSQRGKGFGTQLIGQAVQHTRPQGGSTLTTPLPARRETQTFFARNGFHPADDPASHRPILRKEIRFREEFLNP